MFCLRAWLPLLVLITNASPATKLLFIIGTYLLSRPCVYCSILLSILVLTLLDFNDNWFEIKQSIPTETATEIISSLVSGNGTITDAVLETASLALSAANSTGGYLASAAMEGVRRRGGENASVWTAGHGFEWLRGLLEKKISIRCLDVVVRL